MHAKKQHACMHRRHGGTLPICRVIRLAMQWDEREAHLTVQCANDDCTPAFRLQTYSKVVFIKEAITEDVANNMIALSLHLDSVDNKRLYYWLNCPGGDVSPCRPHQTEPLRTRAHQGLTMNSHTQRSSKLQQYALSPRPSLRQTHHPAAHARRWCPP